MKLFKAVCFICFLLVLLTPSFALEGRHFEDETGEEFEGAGYPPLYYISPNSGNSEWKKNAPYEIGYPLFYSLLIVLPLLPFICFMIPNEESLLLQQENERKRQQEIDREHQEESERAEEDESLTDTDDEEYHDPEIRPSDMIPQTSSICSRSASFIGKRLATAAHVTKLELRAPRVVMETSSKHKSEEGKVTVHEQLPDARDSVERLKELGARICPESAAGKACVAVASGVLISYGIYRLFSK